MTHNLLVIGSGGREHTLAWALSRSSSVARVYVAPGNGGTDWPQGSGHGLQPQAPCQSVDIAVDDFPALIQFAHENTIDLTIVGPEIPLAAGIVDAFQAAGLSVFGPVQAAAQLEASKAFSKDFMRGHHIPTADYGIFTDYDAAWAFLHDFQRPVVVKASGLAAGKGVLICDTVAEAETALQSILLDRAFGAAGDQVVIEERLEGREISLLAFCDGQTAVPMLIARDHKRALDGDGGLNTGGMGAFAPVTDIAAAQVDDICRTVLQPVLDGMRAQGTPYVGILYAGLMLTVAGVQTLEFNCRFGDPEAQVILPLLATDLYDILRACVDGRLHEIAIEWKAESCATVVLASPGYPAAYPKGLPISGLDELTDGQVMVFHAGTGRKDGQVITAGGRVLAVTATGPNLDSALGRVYAAIDHIHFENMHFRHDIGRTS